MRAIFSCTKFYWSCFIQIYTISVSFIITIKTSKNFLYWPLFFINIIIYYFQGLNRVGLKFFLIYFDISHGGKKNVLSASKITVHHTFLEKKFNSKMAGEIISYHFLASISWCVDVFFSRREKSPKKSSSHYSYERL